MKKFFALILSGILVFSTLMPVSAYTPIPAFPGAEGGGKFTTGGRGTSVYIVTTLEDYAEGEEPIKGSLRDAVSEDNRIIVFDVSGIINLKETLRINCKNISILGQTAPGDGITVSGYATNVSNSENVIIRYMRFRPGADNVHKGDSMDALWGRSMKNFIVDHVSASWSTDETMSLYRAENMTVQWSIIAESLTMSGHTKGRHGYGAIMGGVNTTYHHNLIANHTSRNPRMGGGTVEADDNEHIAHFDMRNNVIYNWGFNSCYGGGRSEANFVYNYLKPGPGTREEVSSRLMDAGEKDKPGSFYLKGNVLEGNAEVTADNNKGIYIADSNAPFTTISDTPFLMDGIKARNLTTDTAEDAYTKVLAMAGATFPRRDAVDARIINEVKNGIGEFANRHEEVGGYPYTESYLRDASLDIDRDGIPNDWESANGLDPNDPSDSQKFSPSGYTYIELYANSLVDMNYIPDNPEITLTSPSDNAVLPSSKAVQIKAEVNDDDNIAKVEFYSDDIVIGTDESAPYEMSINLPDGTYNISAKATDSDGNATQSFASTIYVNDTQKLNQGWESSDIGSPAIVGNAVQDGNTATIKGAGKIQADSDSFRYAYTTLEGNGEIIAKVDEMTPVDNHAFAGLMIRENLDPDSKTAAVGLSWTKSYQWKETDPETGKSTTYYRNPWSAYMAVRSATGGNMPELGETLDSPENAAAAGIPLVNDIHLKEGDTWLGYYLKLTRNGNTFTAYCSPDGNTWTEIGSAQVDMSDTIYIGLAADGNKVSNQLNNLNTVKFSDISVTKY